MIRDLATLEDAIGYRFTNRDLAEQAMTHASRSQNPEDRLHSNERLEFLGDRVLALVVTEMLYDAYPEDDEGSLSRRLNALVRRETLADVAERIGLPGFMIMSKGEAEQGGRENPSLTSDAMEALIAAVHLDGGADAARKLIADLWHDLVIDGPAEPPKDPKTALQEWSQSQNRGLPNYSIVSQEGPSHAPEFTVRVRVSGMDDVHASGTSKQRAEQAAAEAMLALATADTDD